MQIIYLDISNKGVIPTINAKQNEVGRKFKVVLTDGGLPYEVPFGAAISIWFSGTAGNGNYSDVGIKKATIVSANTITVELIPQMLLTPGDGTLCLILNSISGEQIGLWNIPYLVEYIPGADSEAVGEYYDAFYEAVSKLTRTVGMATDEGGEIFNFYTDPVYTGDVPPKEYPGNTAAKGAHAQNFGTHADGEYSSASGWNSTASGGIANATGRETLASGYAATTEGHLTTASGRCAHAGGKESEATGTNAFAHGLRAKATNNTSFAIGEDTEASGFYSVAAGYKTKASGTCSSATGRETEAQQYASSAQGRGTIATSRNQSVRGAYNIPDTPDANGNGEFAEIVGGGKNANDRANIYTLDWQGNAQFAGEIVVGSTKERLAKVSEIPTKAADINAISVGTYGFGATAYEGNTANYPQYAYKIGWYFVPNGVSPTGQAGVMRVETSNKDTFVHQTFYPEDNQGYILRRYGKYNNFEPWEWVNPPMIAGVEYRTTERYDGKPVYAKRIVFGKLPNSDTAYVSGISSQVNIVSLHGVAKGGNETNSFPVIVGGQIAAYAFAQKATDGTRIYVKAVSDASAYTAEFILKYTKD